MRTPFNPFKNELGGERDIMDASFDSGPVGGFRITTRPDSPFHVPVEVQFIDRVERVTRYQVVELVKRIERVLARRYES